MHTVWIIVGVVAVLLVLLLLIKSKACNCCGDCDCCCECGDCCTLSSLAMFVLGVVALWGGALASLGYVVLSLLKA